MADDLGWHAMECGLCPETWWLPFGDTPYGTQVIGLAARHWRDHVARGEDPRADPAASSPKHDEKRPRINLGTGPPGRAD